MTYLGCESQWLFFTRDLIVSKHNRHMIEPFLHTVLQSVFAQTQIAAQNLEWNTINGLTHRSSSSTPFTPKKTTTSTDTKGKKRSSSRSKRYSSSSNRGSTYVHEVDVQHSSNDDSSSSSSDSESVSHDNDNQQTDNEVSSEPVASEPSNPSTVVDNNNALVPADDSHNASLQNTTLYDQLFAVISQSSNTQKKGCDMAIYGRNGCPDGDRCRFSHDPKDMMDRMNFLMDLLSKKKTEISAKISSSSPKQHPRLTTQPFQPVKKAEGVNWASHIDSSQYDTSHIQHYPNETVDDE